LLKVLRPANDFDAHKGTDTHVDGGANIDIGSSSNGIIVSNIVSKYTRSWSCLHLIQSGNDNPCTNVTITNNQIGPCGNEGTNSAGQGLWADGISFACENSLIENNYVGI
jgi:hypothetical protein